MGSFLTPLQVSDAAGTPSRASPAQLSQDYHLSLGPLSRPQDRAVINQRQKQEKKAEKCNQLGKGRVRQGCDNLLPAGAMGRLHQKGAGRGFRGGLQGQEPQLGPQQAQGVIPSPTKIYSPLCTQAQATLSPGSAPCPPPSRRLLPTCSCPPFPCQLTTLVRTGVQTLLTHAHGDLQTLVRTLVDNRQRHAHAIPANIYRLTLTCTHALGPDRPSHGSLQDTGHPSVPQCPPPPPGHDTDPGSSSEG